MSPTKPVRMALRPTALTVALVVMGACGSKTASPATTIVGPTWQVKERVENGGKPSLPDCAKDDTLSFTKEGTFTSRIAGTQCNPNEVDAVDQKFMWSSDNKVITFGGDGFSYTGKVLKLTKSQLVIEFDLGPGFVIRDTFTPKP